MHREPEARNDGRKPDRAKAVEGQVRGDQRCHLRNDHVEVSAPRQGCIQGRHAGRSGQQHRVGDLRDLPEVGVDRQCTVAPHEA